MTEEVLLSVKGLKRYFDVGRGEKLKAVDGINFDIKKGKHLGLSASLVAGNRQLVEPFSDFTIKQMVKCYTKVKVFMT